MGGICVWCFETIRMVLFCRIVGIGPVFHLFVPNVFTSLFSVEEALDGFLGILRFAKHKKKEQTENSISEHMLNAIEEMAKHAAGILRMPQYEPRYPIFHTLQKHDK